MKYKIKFRVQCPRCNQRMLCEVGVNRLCDVSKKSKRCVYCGRTFKIHSGNNSRIVERLN